MTQLGRDLAALCERRAALGLVGGTIAAFWLQGCRREPSHLAPSDRPPGSPLNGMARVQGYPEITATAPDGSTCVAFPGETEGPFAADGRGRGAVASVLDAPALVRSDIRSSFGGLSGTAEGVPLDLELSLVDVDDGCAAMAGRAVYLWHCDAAGRYSLYELPQQNYLRGLQVADAAGLVRFRTVVPAAYPGRFPHLHFEVFESAAAATGGREARLTSQLALPPSTAAAVYAASPLYRESIARLARTPLAEDGVFADNTAAQLRAQTLRIRGDHAVGLRGRAVVGLTRRYG